MNGPSPLLSLPSLPARHHRLHKGMTLVELLVALTLFSLILSLIFSGLRASGKSWERSAAQINNTDNLRLELAFVCKTLGEAVPLVLLDGKQNPVVFKGEPDAIHFTAQLPSHRGGGGLYLLSLSTVEHGDKRELQLAYQSISPALDIDHLEAGDDGKTMTLMTDINTLIFSYYGSEDTGKDPEWSDTWHNQQNLPLLVRIHIEPANKASHLPDLVVRLATQSVRGQPQLTLYKSNAGSDTGAAVIEPASADK